MIIRSYSRIFFFTMSDNITFYDQENILNGILNLYMNKHKEERR